jgi:hypothetical protein
MQSRTWKNTWDLGIVVDDYRSERIITVGGGDFRNRPYGPTPFGVVMITYSIINAVNSDVMKDDPNDITYTYLKGTAAYGFDKVPAEGYDDFVKIAVDNFELRNAGDRKIDYTAYFSSDKYWIGIHSFVDSPRYFITKFPVKN